MICKFRILVFAAIAISMASFVGASAAQATPVVTAEGGENLTLSGVGGGLEGQEKFTLFGSTVECEKSEYGGEATNGSATLTLFIGWGSECKAFGGLPATVTMNGCHFVFHLRLRIFPFPRFRLRIDIVCEIGKQIEIHVYGSQTAHANNTALCTVKIPAQTGLEGAEIATKTTEGGNFGDAELSGKVEGIHATQVRNSFLCPSGTETTAGAWEINTPVTIVGNHDFDISGE